MSASGMSTNLLSPHLLACPRPACEGDRVGTVRILVIPVSRDEKVARLLGAADRHTQRPSNIVLACKSALCSKSSGGSKRWFARTVILCAISGCCLFRVATTCAFSAASVQRLWSSYTLDCGSPVPQTDSSVLFNRMFEWSQSNRDISVQALHI